MAELWGSLHIEAITHGDQIAGLWWDDLCPGANTYIGYDGRPTSELYFEGRIDDVRIYSCALTAEEIAEQSELSTALATGQQFTRVNVHPNPSNGLLRVSGLRSGASIHLFDAIGRQVTTPRSFQQAEAVLDISFLPHGMYVLAVDGARTTVIRE